MIDNVTLCAFQISISLNTNASLLVLLRLSNSFVEWLDNFCTKFDGTSVVSNV